MKFHSNFKPQSSQLLQLQNDQCLNECGCLTLQNGLLMNFGLQQMCLSQCNSQCSYILKDSHENQAVCKASCASKCGSFLCEFMCDHYNSGEQCKNDCQIMPRSLPGGSGILERREGAVMSQETDPLSKQLIISNPLVPSESKYDQITTPQLDQQSQIVMKSYSQSQEDNPRDNLVLMFFICLIAVGLIQFTYKQITKGSDQGAFMKVGTDLFRKSYNQGVSNNKDNQQDESQENSRNIFGNQQYQKII
eukprot:403352032